MKVEVFPVAGKNLQNPTSPGSGARNSNVACYTAQLSSDGITNDDVVVSCYELRVVICNYQNYPITVEYRTPSETFTTRVDPVSAPPEFVIERSEI